MHVHTIRRLWSQSLHLLASVSMTLLLLAGCGGDGGGGAPPAASPLSGVFIDSPVQGLGYTTSTGLSGTTDANGRFNYNAGDTVTFTLYGRSIGTSVPAGPVVTALMVFNATSLSDFRVINLAQLLLGLAGGPPAAGNPIIVPPTIPAGFPATIDFSAPGFDTSFPPSVTVVSEATATTHLSASFKTLAVTLVNSGTVTSNPAGITCTTGTCSAVFQTGTVVTLTATGTGFTGWSGGTGSAACTGTGTCVITLNADSTITATFPVAAPAAGWQTLGTTVFAAGGPVRLGGLAVAPNGRVGVTYVTGSSGTAGLVGELRVSEWDGATWTQVGGALNLTANDGVSLSTRSLAYDATSRPVVAWLDRFTLTLIVQRWSGMAWVRLGNPKFSGGATIGDPQVMVDPVTDRPIVVISSGPITTVRDWTGSAWSPADTQPSMTSLGGGPLIVSRSGQRLLAHVYGADSGGTQRLARLHSPAANGQYTVESTGPILPTPIGARDFFLDLANNASDPFPNAFALIGDSAVGPMAVRTWTGATGWQSVGADPGIRDRSAQLRVTPFGLPLIAYLQGSAAPRRVDGVWFDGTTWQSVASANEASVDVIQFALGLAPNGRPYIALTQRDPTSPSQRASELVVRRLVPTTLTVVVSGPAGSGIVTAGGQTCPVGSTCDVPLPAGTEVALDATPADRLQSWTGCDAVNVNRCSVTVNQSRTVTATFQ